jgi:hypothetical protein
MDDNFYDKKKITALSVHPSTNVNIHIQHMESVNSDSFDSMKKVALVV